MRYIPVQPGEGGEPPMEKKIFYNVDEVAEMLSISRSHGYKIIRELNRELQERDTEPLRVRLAVSILTRSSMVCRQLKEGE